MGKPTSVTHADHTVSPPHIDIPRQYNAAADLLGRNLEAGRAGKPAFIDDRRTLTYGELATRADRFGSALKALGLAQEDRIMLAMLDTADWPVAFLGAIKAGIVPIAANTLLTPRDYAFMLEDSRAKVLVVSHALLPGFASQLGQARFLRQVVVVDAPAGSLAPGQVGFEELLEQGMPALEAAPTTGDDACFWLYSSGSTGAPKGTVHIHSSLVLTAELYARPVLGIRETDKVFSAAKLFFAYGLGNGLTFPMAVGATAVLMAERPTPAAVFKRLTEHRPDIFYGVPTLYAALLASPDFPQRTALGLRICTSAGEALPADIGRRWTERTGTEILDGLGSTELLHIFLSNRPNEVRYGTSGTPVPGYRLKVLDEHGSPVKPGEVGDLYICGPTAAASYWNQREKSRATFQGEWTRSGDKYTVDAEGVYTYAGRSDDMLKVSGIYVSPFEVEGALLTHPAVLECAVVGHADADELIKPKAFIVLKSGASVSDDELKSHVKSQLAPYKYPRWVEFVTELPKTATGKIQRFKLRG